ncbi:single-stranded DNA-binding protein [Pseudarthrobacter sp. J1763]|uniref:single-stranded DNA-binding protein n=1 Tax=Pseudarthrobacter sp. J1763 TaxID=3420445 RepID=UPI003D2C8836
MSDTITVRGFVATEPRSGTTTGGTPTVNFRIATTERRFDKENSVWVDGPTNWYTISAYRHLAGNVVCSVKKGHRVLVVGKLKLRQWEHEGKLYHQAEIDADAIGHDLAWGTANYVRNSSATPASAEGVGGMAPVHVEGVGTVGDGGELLDEQLPEDTDGGTDPSGDGTEPSSENDAVPTKANKRTLAMAGA